MIKIGSSLSSYNTRLYDQFGNEARSRRPEIANSGDSALLVSGVPVAGRITFEGISPQATNIPLLKLRGRINRKSFEIEFRNIPLAN